MGRIYISKVDYIKQLEADLLATEKKVANNTTQIKSIQSRLQSNDLKSKSGYKGIRKYTKVLLKFINQDNILQAHAISTRYAIKRATLSTNEHRPNKLNTEQLYQYIKYIEDTHTPTTMPFNLNAINRIKINNWKLYKRLLKLEYLENIVLPKVNIVRKKYYEIRINKLNKDIDYYKNYIVGLKSGFASKHHARLVKRLEKSSKKIVKEPKYNGEYLIDLQNAVKYYNNGTLAVKVLKDINLQIKRGEFIVILGPSGSGKTTLLNIISGMDTATYGKTFVANANLIKLNSSQLTEFRRQNIGYIFQQYGLLPNLTVRENVEIGANLQSDVKKRLKIDDILKGIGIYEVSSKFPSELSGGQQQRVSIARSMAKNPNLIFGDEPTGAIDEEMSKQIMQLFVDINRKFKTTVIIVTHNPILADLATVTIKVANGEIAKIIRNPKPKNVNQLAWSK